MTGADLLVFAARALRGHRLRSILSLLGVAIGIASVMVLTSLGAGARSYVTGEFASLGSNLLIVIPGKIETTGGPPVKGGVPNDLTLEDAEAILRRSPRVTRVAPLVLGTAMGRHGDLMREVTVVGTTTDFLPIRQISTSIGRFLPSGREDENARVCVIGTAIQRELFGGGNPLGSFLRIGDERYRIIGVVAPRGVSIGIDLDEVVYIPVRAALKLFNRTTLFRVLAQIRSHQEADAAREDLIQILKERHNGVEDVTVITQDSVLSAFTKILGVLTAALAAIAAVSLAVAGIGIMNVMLVSVAERTSEIGLLKALGAERWQILGAFLAEASLLSSLGGGLGVAAGYGLSALIRGLWPVLPAYPPGWAVVSAFAVAAIVGLLFGFLPARRAATLDPVLALARRGA
jgi:putative ABC transport system permease protein